MNKFCIFLGGSLTVTERLKKQIQDCRFIAADGGIRHAQTLGVMPELWLGDFDSSENIFFETFSSCPKMGFPVEKDMTDGELATTQAIEHGATEIILCGAFGGSRIDHAMLHMVFALSLRQKNIPIMLTSGDVEGYPLFEKQEFDFPLNTLFSIIGFSDIKALTIEGAKWPVNQCDIPTGSSLTLSNVVNSLPLKTKIKSGSALLIGYPKMDA